MKRILFLGLGAALLASFPITHEAMARGRQERVNLCHNTELVATDTVHCRKHCPDGTIAFGVATIEIYAGQVIVVAAASAPAHLAHGDGAAPVGASPGDECTFRRLSRCDAICR